MDSAWLSQMWCRTDSSEEKNFKRLNIKDFISGAAKENSWGRERSHFVDTIVWIRRITINTGFGLFKGTL
jgi:hypothetical protein